MTKTRQYTIFRMLQYLKELWGYMALNCLICMVYELLPLVNMFLLSYMITSLLDGAAIGYDRMLGVLLLSVVLQSAFGYLNMWTEHDIAYRLLYKLRFEIYCRLEKAIPSFRREISTAEMTSIVTNDMNLLEWFYAHTVNIFVVSAAVFLGIMVFFYSIHPLFAANAVLWMGLYLLTPVIFRKKSFEDGKAIRESYGKLSGVMMDSIQGMREIISFNFWSEYKKRIFRFVDRYDKSKQVDGKRRALEWMYTLLVMSMMNTLALLISVYVAKAPEEQRWIMVVFIVGSSVFTVFNKFIAMSTQFSSIFAAARRVFDLLNLPVQVEDSGEEVFSEKIESIEFRNVSFSYPNSTETQIKNMSFLVQRGTRVAVSGESGAGKSTIINLLQRYADPDSGAILANGRDIRSFTLESWRNSISVVGQNSYLFKGSVADNIEMGKPGASSEEIETACKLSQAHEFILRLKDGYNTEIGERALKLSGGQRQRLSIARAVLKGSSLLLFDEVQSDLDSENEEVLNEKLSELVKDRILFSIAHRVSSIAAADKVLFIDAGERIALDTFENLKKNSRLFREKVLGLG